MAKVLAPLFSLDARGTLAHAITFGANQYGNWVRRIVTRANPATPAQVAIRDLFLSSLNLWKIMSGEEKFLWNLALTNYEKYGSTMGRNFSRMGRCLWLHHALTPASFDFLKDPFPPELHKMLANDEISGLSQTVADLALLTGLPLCSVPDFYFFKYLGLVTTKINPAFGQPIAGLTSASTAHVALDEGYYNQTTDWERKNIVAHELTHCLLMQRGLYYSTNVVMSETIANECGDRVANGDLSPVYTYEGYPLSDYLSSCV